MQSNHLVIGLGEVGKSLMQVFQEAGFDVQGVDKELEVEPASVYDFIHIAFPYFNTFVQEVKSNKAMWLNRDGVCVIHSSVPVGTSDDCEATHSPIHGLHPNLAKSIQTFTKFIGKTKDAERVLLEFSRARIKGRIVDNNATSEISKLGCTRRYGLAIIEQKEFKKECDEVGANFEQAYTEWNHEYNNGYRQMGLPYNRYVIRDVVGPIGGHCILPNLKLLPSPTSTFIEERNNAIIK